MYLEELSAKLGSLRVWPVVLGLGVTLGSAGGCIVVDDGHHGHGDGYDDYGYNDPPPPSDQTVLATIDPDQTLNAEAGSGVGMFVEYQAGGRWRVWTTCDTDLSGASCVWDACVSVADGSSVISNVVGEGLGDGDRIVVYGDGANCLSVETDFGIEGMSFETAPGAPVRLEMALDGYSEPRFVFWVGDGVLHSGAPSNPIDFQPASP